MLKKYSVNKQTKNRSTILSQVQLHKLGTKLLPSSTVGVIWTRMGESISQNPYKSNKII